MNSWECIVLDVWHWGLSTSNDIKTWKVEEKIILSWKFLKYVKISRSWRNILDKIYKILKGFVSFWILTMDLSSGDCLNMSWPQTALLLDCFKKLWITVELTRGVESERSDEDPHSITSKCGTMGFCLSLLCLS